MTSKWVVPDNREPCGLDKICLEEVDLGVMSPCVSVKRPNVQARCMSRDVLYVTFASASKTTRQKQRVAPNVDGDSFRFSKILSKTFTFCHVAESLPSSKINVHIRPSKR